MDTITCPVCGTSFQGTDDRKYCSGPCYYARFTTPEQQVLKEERYQASLMRQQISRSTRYVTDPEFRARTKEKAGAWLKKYREEVALGLRPRTLRTGGRYDTRKAYRELLFILLLERDGWDCGECAKRLTWDTMSLDHIIPRSLGGENLPANVRLVHLVCNSSRPKKREFYMP